MEVKNRFRVGDVVNVIPYKETMKKHGYSYGISQTFWDEVVRTNPHIIYRVRYGHSYELSNDSYGFGWPSWAFEPDSWEVDVDDLL